MDKTIGKTTNLTIGTILNITIKYLDNLTKNFINSALVNITGPGINSNLTENATLEQYTVLINTSILGVGVKFLTVSALKENYTLEMVLLTITVTSREAIIDTIYLNSMNKTIEKSIEIPISSILNVTIGYSDNVTKNSINSALVNITGNGFVLLPKDPVLQGTPILAPPLLHFL